MGPRPAEHVVLLDHRGSWSTVQLSGWVSWRGGRGHCVV